MSNKTIEKLVKDNPKTFENFDQLHLESFAKSLTNHIIAEYPYVEGSLVISLNGKFGSGKSCFLEMFQNYLKNNRGYDAIYINAWKNDFFNEPVVTIASEIIDYLNQKQSKSHKVINALKDTLYLVAGSFALSANQAINKLTGVNIKESAEALEKDAIDRELRPFFKQLLPLKLMV